MLTITIDGKETSVPAGSTILDAAKQLDIEIPTLCYFNIEELSFNNKTASCRVCVVEVEGRRNLAPACATPVTDGMAVSLIDDLDPTPPGGNDHDFRIDASVCRLLSAQCIFRRHQDLTRPDHAPLNLSAASKLIDAVSVQPEINHRPVILLRTDIRTGTQGKIVHSGFRLQA